MSAESSPALGARRIPRGGGRDMNDNGWGEVPESAEKAISALKPLFTQVDALNAVAEQFHEAFRETIDELAGMLDATRNDLESARCTIAAVESALRYVPLCEASEDDASNSGGWKRAVADVRSALIDPKPWL